MSITSGIALFSCTTNCTVVKCAFDQWRERDGNSSLSDRLVGPWLVRLRLNIAMDAKCIGELPGLLKKSCRQDKAVHLRQLAQDVDEAEPQNVHRACRRPLQPKKKRSHCARPLLSLMWPDGTPCKSPQKLFSVGESTLRLWRLERLLRPNLWFACVAKAAEQTWAGENRRQEYALPARGGRRHEANLP